MKTMSASEFKAKCLQTMSRVDEKREVVTITRRGKPLVRVVPIEEERPRSAVGCLEGKVTVAGDLLAPVTPLAEWGT